MILVYVSVIIALILTLLSGIPYLDFLKKNFYGQAIREDGPASHSVKAGTPTTGGIIIIIPAIIASILGLLMAEKANIDTLIILATFCLSTFIGLRDDIIKITKQQNKGLSAKGKLFLQILIAAIPALYMTFTGHTSISFFDLFNVDLGILYPLIAIFIIIGTSNAVNLTDGLDGLASGTAFVSFLGATCLCIIANRIDLAIVAVSIAGSCLGFLYFNKYPAKIFMGDTGSLALGTALGTLAVIGKIELWLLLLGFIFVIETLSVIIQVISFKTTGKRIFKMSPIHHHFELSGWSEQKVVKVFWIIGFIFTLTACVLRYIIY